GAEGDGFNRHHVLHGQQPAHRGVQPHGAWEHPSRPRGRVDRYAGVVTSSTGSDSAVEDVLLEAADKMGKAVAHTQGEFSGIRTGRATPALVEKMKVDYYGAEVPLQQLAGFSVPEARVLVIAPYDKNSIKAIERAI